MTDPSVDYLLDQDLETLRPATDELRFWKSCAIRLQAALRDERQSLEEFRIDSREYEGELEHNISLLEAQVKELRGAVGLLQLEIDHWKSKYQDEKKESHRTIESLQREMNFLREQQQSFIERTRNLELDNDDLERHGREALSTIRDLESRLGQITERNAFLEKEFEIKRKLVVVVQRLKDELRDLQLEVSVLRSKKGTLRSSKPMDVEKPSEAVLRVQEMLGRIKSLEHRLTNCRNVVQPGIEAEKQKMTSLRNEIQRRRNAEESNGPATKSLKIDTLKVSDGLRVGDNLNPVLPNSTTEKDIQRRMEERRMNRMKKLDELKQNKLERLKAQRATEV